ncbi:hypothetical protein [Castellaniella sp. UC4442_H9]|jgi:hypothetical protein
MNPCHLAAGESSCPAGDACSPALLVGAFAVLPPEVPPAGALDGPSVVELPALELLALELPVLELPALELPAVEPLLAGDAGVLSVEGLLADGLLADGLLGGTAAPGAYLPPLAKFAACISDRQVELPKNTTLSSFATITASSVAE